MRCIIIRKMIHFRCLIFLGILLTSAALSGCGGVSDGSMDGDMPAINIIQGAFTFNENPEKGKAAIGTLPITLATKPNANVVLVITSPDETEVVVDPSEVTFTPDTWDRQKMVYLYGRDDDEIDGNQTCQITVKVNPDPKFTGDTTGYRKLAPVSQEVTVLDDDQAAVTVTSDALTLSEVGGTASFDVMLNTIPNGDVVIDLSHGDLNGEATIDKTSLTFTAEDWFDPQTVTVTGNDNEVNDGDLAFAISLSINTEATTDTTGYAEVERSKDIAVKILESLPGVTVTAATTIYEDERTGKGSIQVVLNSKPNGNVVLDIINQDTSEATVDRAQLTFISENETDKTNWSIPQTILLTPIDDDLVDGNTNFKIVIKINKELTTDTTGYVALPDGAIAAVPVTVIDDDTAGVTVEPETLTISENKGADTFSVQLNSQPNGIVAIRIISTDESEAITDSDPLLFTNENWFEKKFVTISGVEDFEVDGNQTVIITVSVDPDETSDTTGYADLEPTDIKDVNVTVTDYDKIGVTVSPRTLPYFSENGGSEEFSVQLNTIPNGTVTFDILSPNPDQAVVNKKTLSFNHLTWSTPQKILVSGVNNEVIDGNRTSIIVVNINPASTTDETGYLDLDPDDVTVQIQDDDAAGITASSTALSLPETGGTATFTVTLDNQPLGEVLLYVTCLDTTVATVDKEQLTFTSENWQTPQEVTVNAVDDPVGAADRSTTLQIGVQSALNDPVYQGLKAADIPVTVTDVPPAEPTTP